MMRHLKIEKVYYQALNGNAMRMPRKRFMQYYDDLFVSTHAQSVQQASYLEGTQYSYVELLDSLLPKVQADGYLAGLELIVFSFWSPEFDPDHACGAYLSHHYPFFGKILDISDAGFLSPFTALAAIKVYMEKGGVQRALLLSMDQTTVPRSGAMSSDILPQCTSVSAWIIVQDTIMRSGLQLISSNCVAAHNLTYFFRQLIEKKQIKPSNSLLTVNRDAVSAKAECPLLPLPFKNIVYRMQTGNSVEKLCALKILREINHHSQYACHILLVEDAVRQQWGVCMIRIIL